MSRLVYLTRSQYKRINAAFIQAITESRWRTTTGKEGKACFPCWRIFHCGANGEAKDFSAICPIGSKYAIGSCVRAGHEGLKHSEWIGLYYLWLRNMSKTFQMARDSLEDWEGFLKLDTALAFDVDNPVFDEKLEAVKMKIYEMEERQKKIDSNFNWNY